MRVRSAAAVVGLFALLSCDKLTTIHYSDESTATVDQGSILEQFVGDLGFGDFLNVDVVDSEELQNQGVEPGDIQDVHLAHLELEATSPDGADLSFLSSVEFYVEAPDLPKQRIAWQDTFPEGQALVEFNLDDVDLTDYAVSESMNITTEVNGHRPDQQTEVTGRYQLDIGVTAQGACSEIKK